MFCPTKFHLSPSDKELLEREDREESQQEILRGIAKELPIYTRTNSGGAVRCAACLLAGQGLSEAPLLWNWPLCVSSAVRFCERCQLLKPDRCHHCSVCDQYVGTCTWSHNTTYRVFIQPSRPIFTHCVTDVSWRWTTTAHGRCWRWPYPKDAVLCPKPRLICIPSHH